MINLNAFRMTCAALAVSGALAAGQAAAVPIVYEGSLTPGVTTGGFVNDPSLTGSPNDDFWSFTLTADGVVTITVNRLNADLDPALYLYAGVGADTDTLAFIDFADDDIPALPGFAGPFSDPFLSIFLTAGSYTVQVWDFASGPQIPGGFCYQITLDRSPTGQEFGCTARAPEPASLALLGLALAGFGISRRAMKK